jgi:hypothetical protein
MRSDKNMNLGNSRYSREFAPSYSVNNDYNIQDYSQTSEKGITRNEFCNYIELIKSKIKNN